VRFSQSNELRDKSLYVPLIHILVVDLEYPEEIHDEHSDLPLVPHYFNKKLMCTLYKKEKYVIHYRNLKLHLQQGMKLTNVHKIIWFKQSDWLKKYIGFNKNCRVTATSDFGNDFYKLMNNAVYGKTTENIEKRRGIKLCTEMKASKLVKKPNFKSRTVFDKNLTAVHMKKTTIKYDKPIYFGMVILDLSKVHMYNFHYNIMKKRIKDTITEGMPIPDIKLR
jgi:hypothetical protein